MVEAIFGHLKTLGSRSLLWSDGLLHRGLPGWSQFSLGWVLCCLRFLPKDEVSCVEPSYLDPFVVVSGHCFLVFGHSLHGFLSSFVNQVQVAVKLLLILLVFVSFDSKTRQSHFHWYDGLSAKCQSKWCFSCQNSCGHSICPKEIWQFFRPCPFCPLKPSFDNFEQVSICHFCLTIGLRMSWRTVAVLDFQVLANFSKLGIVELLSII